jgi:hypothetical protein|tara:strand:+ start:369 stop:545 length:177 start_codon:yes stop_codon:yes gene_type:complete
MSDIIKLKAGAAHIPIDLSQLTKAIKVPVPGGTARELTEQEARRMKDAIKALITPKRK